MKESSDGFVRADQIDLKSLDEQLERHLNRAWTMEKSGGVKEREREREREEWDIDPSKLIIKTVIARGTFGIVHRGVYDGLDVAESRVQTFSSCPQSIHWSDDGLERDLYIEATTVTVLAVDGKRRWLDIQKLGSDGKSHFMFVTNLAPCSGVRLHLWPEKSKITSEVPPSKRVVEVTSKMLHIPAGPAPRQIEPGSQTEQAPPSAVLRLGPEDMHGFRFLTISVAPSPTVSGRPPPAAAMAVGQFFNPEEGKREFSHSFLLFSSYAEQEFMLVQDHPLALNLSFSISLGIAILSTKFWEKVLFDDDPSVPIGRAMMNMFF